MFTGCSTSVYRSGVQHEARSGDWRTIFNGVDASRYTLQEQIPSDAPLVFLGRLDPIKGAHDAIEIARRAGRRLIIAGTRVASGPDVAYFDREIAPHVDGESVRFIGPVDDAAKDRVLGTAAALLMPIGWEKPFGIVMAEAFACGTPVIAFARGSVPEVIREGVNGFACRTVDEPPMRSARSAGSIVARFAAIAKRASGLP